MKLEISINLNSLKATGSSSAFILRLIADGIDGKKLTPDCVIGVPLVEDRSVCSVRITGKEPKITEASVICGWTTTYANGKQEAKASLRVHATGIHHNDLPKLLQ